MAYSLLDSVQTSQFGLSAISGHEHFQIMHNVLAARDAEAEPGAEATAPVEEEASVNRLMSCVAMKMTCSFMFTP